MNPDILKNKGFIISLLVMVSAFVVQYYIDFLNMAGRWDNEDNSYCYLVPIIFAYLVYACKDDLKNLNIGSSFCGIIVIVLSCFIYLVGNLSSVSTLSAISIWITIIGITLIIFGRETVKKLSFPFIILAFMVPLPPFVKQSFYLQAKTYFQCHICKNDAVDGYIGISRREYY